LIVPPGNPRLFPTGVSISICRLDTLDERLAQLFGNPKITLVVVSLSGKQQVSTGKRKYAKSSLRGSGGHVERLFIVNLLTRFKMAARTAEKYRDAES